MEKRSAARELAFLALFQLPRNTDKIDINKLSKMDFHAICLSSIRTLTDFTKTNIKKAETFFIKTERALMEYQVNHPDNEKLSEATRPVAIPNTQEFVEHLNNCYQAIEMIKGNIQLPEIYWHYQDEEIQEFALNLLMKYVDHKAETENTIKEISKSWDIERMQKVDRLIIEMALTEIAHTDVPPSVVAAEAVKIANKYSTPEGAKFINGVVADLIKIVTN